MQETIYYERPWLYPKQLDAFFHESRIGVCEATTKGGKAQPLDALISTPRGWRCMGDIAVGDVIHGLKENTRVTGVFPQGKKPVYKIVMSDGSETTASEDHLWSVLTSWGEPRILTTKEISEKKPWELRRCYVPQHNAVEYAAKDAPSIDPWLLGYLLGDGCFIGSSLEVAIGFTKFVPDCYKFGSIQTRTAIIQGLLDSDGWVNWHGQPVLEQCSKRLSEDFIHIIRSLGGVVRSTVKTSASGKPVYHDCVNYHTPASLFRMSRKGEKCRATKKPIKKTFRSIEYVGDKECQCIRVAAEDHLYITNDFIATHNTHAALIWLFEQAILGKAGQNYWWIAPVYPQANIAFQRMRRGTDRSFIKANESDLKIELGNGAIVWFKSGEKPDNLYGEDVYAAVIDEASRVREESWHAIRSTLTATRGPIRMIGNVKGRRNWFYALARKAESGSEGLHYSKIVAADAVAAGILEKEEIENARRDLPENVFRELYEAEPSDDGGNPFGISAIQSCIKPLSTKPPKSWGVDLAKSTDWTVAIALDENGDVCRFHRFQRPWMETIEFLRQTIHENAFIDSTGVGDPITESLQKTNGNFEGFKFSSTSKQQIMEGLAVAIQQNKIGYPAGVIPMELEQFEYEFSRTGVKYSAPPGFHDDSVCSLALAERRRTVPCIGDNILEYWARKDAEAKRIA